MIAIVTLGGRLVDRQVGNVTVMHKKPSRVVEKTISGLLEYVVNWLSFRLSF